MEQVKPQRLPNPRDSANILSILFFLWTLPLIRKGYAKVLELEDIFQPLQADKSKLLGENLERKWHQQLNGKGRPSLLKAIAKTFWREYTLLGVLCLINDVIIRVIQPQLLRQFLGYFKNGSNVTHSDALKYASGMVILNALGAITINQLFITGYHNGMKVRVAVCSLIYRKALKLSHAALEGTAVGKMVNLLSNDVSRFDSISLCLHSMWTAPLLVSVVGYMLWLEAGWAGMIGLTIVFIVVPIQSYASKLAAKYRLYTALRTDERVRFMDEIISGVQVIKMYAWEKPFMQLIALARRMELKVVRKSSYVRALYMTFAMFTTRLSLFCSMLAIVLLWGEEHITAAKVFVISSYLTVVAQNLTGFFIRGIAEIAESLVAFQRLQNFLENDEKVVLSIRSADTKQPEIITNANYIVQRDLEQENWDQSDIAVSIHNMTARWIPVQKTIDMNGFVSPSKLSFKDEKPLVEITNEPTLRNINFEAQRGKLIGIVGTIGSGKSSLLQALLQELPVEVGSIRINGNLSYACQEPWVFAGSVRQNILFGQEMDRFRYDTVVKSCALNKDFEQLEYEDRTLVGEKGASLSGGQKARVNLARAIYRVADIYLLDDPLSAVDTHVGLHLFNECIGPHGLLARQKATRILVTHQVHFLKDADWVLVLKNGEIIAQGRPQDLNTDEFNVIEFLEMGSEDNVENENVRRRKVSRISTKSTSVSSLCSDYEGIRRDSEFDAGLIESLQYYEESSEGNIKGSLFRKYFECGAHHLQLFIIFLLFILAQLTASGADYWVSFWVSQEERRSHKAVPISDFDNSSKAFISEGYHLLSTELCMLIYGGLIVGVFAVAISRSIFFYNVCLKASQNLHDIMFKGIISTTMRFFNLNPSGRILNRFAKDMGICDELLPRVLLDAIQTNLNMTGAIILTAIVNPIFLVPIAFIGMVFIVARNIYLRTSMNLKRLEGITRSPVFTQISVSLDGLSTIRAFNAEKMLINEFDNHQDAHTACWYMFISTSSAFGFTLDIMCFVFVFIVIFSFLLVETGISGDKVGLAITQALTMTGLLQWGIRHSVEVTNQLMSVERILEYSFLEQEKQPNKAVELSKSWPTEGRIEFQDVTYRYMYEADPVLHRVSFIIEPREKIGIVGRTGAGKSSLIGALFRMAYVKGKILIDGVDTGAINLQDLRSHIAIIPQDPVLFSGTLRMNLDPFEEYPDADIWNALEEVGLKNLTNNSFGLQTPVLAHGTNFSVGQRQLLCLARAILRKNRILVLDEATANVDPQTDLLIQRTIRTNFADCTVLTVAHRLHTIIDSNRVLVMDAGKPVEFDTPHNLLSKRTGIFKEMVFTLSPQEVERLVKTAQINQGTNKSKTG